MSYFEKDEIIDSIIPLAEHYSLVNNYGWHWDSNGYHYDLRHVLNVYGCEVNHWDLSIYDPISKDYIGGKNYMSFDETIEELKKLRVE